MSDEEDGAEKSHDPTPKKLEDARKRGEIPKSTDLTTSGSYLGLILVLGITASFTVDRIALTGAGMLENADELSKRAFGMGGGEWLTGHIFTATLPGILPVFGVPALVVLLVLIGQRAIVFAPEKLQPKLNRISPIAGMKNKFGAQGLFEFLKSFVKLLAVGALLLWFMIGKLNDLIVSVSMSPGQISAQIGAFILEFLLLIFVMSLMIGGVDYLWQTANHLKKNRMSRKELQDESKQSEGDPTFKQTRRQRGYEIAMNQMLSEVPDADVIIVNPTHYAVALKWDRGSHTAPTCLAKGVDEIAARIREIASDANIPIHSDPPTARALFATVELGEQILPDHYQAVAAAIRFAEDMRKKSK